MVAELRELHLGGFTLPRLQGDGLRPNLLFADDGEVGKAVGLRVSDALSEGLARIVEDGADADCLEFLGDLPGVLRVRLGDRNDANLLG